MSDRTKKILRISLSKVTLVTTFICSILSAFADDKAPEEKSYQIFGEVTLVSDYVTRGRSINDGTPAIQPHFLFRRGDFFAGIWATTLDVADLNLEVDYYAGYQFQLDKDLKLETALQAITVPQLDNFDFLRINARLSGKYKNVFWSLWAAYDPELDNTATQDGDNKYITFALQMPIEKTQFTLNAGVGYEQGIAVRTQDQNKV